MRIRDKIITAACRTPDGIEWTTLKVKQDGTEPVEHNTFAVPGADSADGGSAVTAIQLPGEVREKLGGDLTASIRTAELLMRTMYFPTTDRAEIAGMVDLQIDKIAPFPLDQLAVSHEVLQETDSGALVLMVAVKHDCIDSIGETFKHKGVYIHSIDARILGWLHLLEKGKHLEGSGCEILIVDDGVDFVLTVLNDGVPIAFRSLPEPEDNGTMAKELADEIGYTLTTLNVEYDLAAPAAIDLWSLNARPALLLAALPEITGLPIRKHSIDELPPLSEGILERALHKKNRIELIPSEWIEYEKMKRLKKRFMISTATLGTLWLIALLAFTGVYQTRAMALAKVKKQEAALSPLADKAIENRKKLRALQSYADRSDSALECLREVTAQLPASDIEFQSFNYNKEKGVALRGTAESDNVVYDYWNALNDSDLFVELKDQRVNNETRQGVQRVVFSLNLVLQNEESAR